jgi:hypothetical protein
MRAASLIPMLILLLLPAAARPDPTDIGPSAKPGYNEANWADWDAQARMTDGDYDGAVQAKQQADAARKAAEERAAQAAVAEAAGQK